MEIKEALKVYRKRLMDADKRVPEYKELFQTFFEELKTCEFNVEKSSDSEFVLVAFQREYHVRLDYVFKDVDRMGTSAKPLSNLEPVIHVYYHVANPNMVGSFMEKAVFKYTYENRRSFKNDQVKDSEFTPDEFALYLIHDLFAINGTYINHPSEFFFN